MKRDEVEREIMRLKEHVNQCYVKFTAFSAARNEQRTGRIDATTAHIEELSFDTVNTALRVEQTVVVNHVENQLRLQRLEVMVARILLNENFGQDFLNRTIGVISSDPMHASVESQHLSAQARRLTNSVRQLMAGGKIAFDATLWEPTRPLRPVILNHALPDGGTPNHVEPPTRIEHSTHVLYWILRTAVEISDSSTRIRSDSIADLLMDFAVALSSLGMISEAIAWQILTTQILAHWAWSTQVLPWLAASLRRLSKLYQKQLQYGLPLDSSALALESSEQALHIWRSLSVESTLDADTRPLFTGLLVTHSTNLHKAGQYEIALTIAREAVAVSRPMMEQS